MGCINSKMSDSMCRLSTMRFDSSISRSLRLLIIDSYSYLNVCPLHLFQLRFVIRDCTSSHPVARICCFISLIVHILMPLNRPIITIGCCWLVCMYVCMYAFIYLFCHRRSLLHDTGQVSCYTYKVRLKYIQLFTIKKAIPITGCEGL
jgi:hypothetical protein